ncbi:hypothetical protein TIFTF001_030146 [Ficus carica]|uniref:Uncharacterized protein n=1 Tax=Ficus carica TaxID=3494 RepID=A0AA88DT49_FICCA|nr:hypothetical protein TIFTF001_030146 [Ficus carica]
MVQDKVTGDWWLEVGPNNRAYSVDLRTWPHIRTGVERLILYQVKQVLKWERIMQTSIGLKTFLTSPNNEDAWLSLAGLDPSEFPSCHL